MTRTTEILTNVLVALGAAVVRAGVALYFDYPIRCPSRQVKCVCTS
jgi:hypothetical protein